MSNSNFLTSAVGAGKTALNIVCSFGPFLLSQSRRMSEAYAEHVMRVGTAEAGKELLLQEIRTIAETRKLLLQRLYEKEPIERFQTARDLEDLDARARRANVHALALDYVPRAAASMGASEQSTTEEPASPPSAHWMDKFSELARSHNEAWRENLLARALAAESAKPGSVSTRALWLIGMLSEEQFRAFHAFLNICIDVAGSPLLPGCAGKFDDRAIPNCPTGRPDEVSVIVYKLIEAGLVSDVVSTKREVDKGKRVTARYGDRNVILTANETLVIKGGGLTTDVGISLAAFCDREWSALGEEIFDSWLAALDATKFPYSVIGPS